MVPILIIIVGGLALFVVVAFFLVYTGIRKSIIKAKLTQAFYQTDERYEESALIRLYVSLKAYAQVVVTVLFYIVLFLLAIYCISADNLIR